MENTKEESTLALQIRAAVTAKVEPFEVEIVEIDYGQRLMVGVDRARFMTKEPAPRGLFYVRGGGARPTTVRLGRITPTQGHPAYERQTLNRRRLPCT